MTNKEFDAKKEPILGLVTDLIINNSSKKMVAKLDEVNKILRSGNYACDSRLAQIVVDQLPWQFHR